MAVTKIIPIRSSIEKSIDYICNPAKTYGSFFIHSEHCSPRTAALEFQHYLSQSRAGGNTIGRHLIQSFAPGEVSPETAHEIGIKLAGEILCGQYAFVMATHVNRGHIHNHFVWCAANVETHKKYRSNKQTYHQIRDASDRLCKENCLSVIVPHGVGKSYTEYNAEKQGTSWKATLKADINEALSETADFNDFLNRMQARGYEIKRGKYISFRAPGQERFTRAKTLGEDFAEDALKRKISQKSAPRTYTFIDRPAMSKPETNIPAEKPRRIGEVIDIQNNEKCQASGAYERWAKLHNLKVCAESLMVFQKYGSVENFEKHFEQCIGDKLTLGQSLNAAQSRIKELTDLRGNIITYMQTKDVYAQYQTAKRRDVFLQKNEADIIKHEAAKRALAKAKPPLPKIKEIELEITNLRASMSETDGLYKQISMELKQLSATRKNLQAITGRDISRPNNLTSDLYI